MNLLIAILAKIAASIFCYFDDMMGRKNPKDDYIGESAKRYYIKNKKCPDYLSMKDCLKLKAKMIEEQNKQNKK